MDTWGWLANWSPRHARLLASVETAEVRATLVDTNGDGRELCFVAELRSPEGDWEPAVDWDDVYPETPVQRVRPNEVIVGWGRAQPGQRKVIEFEGVRYPVVVSPTGWWLLVVNPPSTAASSDPGRA